MSNIVLIDVSSNQGIINWNKLSKKAQAVYIRFGIGNSTLDKYVQRNVEGAYSSGMEWGGYWVAIAGTDWNRHISNFSSALNNFGSGKLPPVWDCEVTQYQYKSYTSNWLSKLIQNSKTILPSKPMIYTRATWWNPNTMLQVWPKEYDLWTAHYTSAPEGTIIAKKPVPWIPDDWTGEHYTFWQYSADGNMLGAEYGVESDSIDISRFYGDSIPAFNLKYGTNIKPLSEIVIPPPPINQIVPIKYAKVTSSILNIRASANVLSNDIGDLPITSIVPVTEIDGDWYKIEGWVNRKYAVDL